jgi:hypothetical protein
VFSARCCGGRWKLNKKDDDHQTNRILSLVLAAKMSSGNTVNMFSRRILSVNQQEKEQKRTCCRFEGFWRRETKEGQ